MPPPSLLLSNHKARGASAAREGLSQALECKSLERGVGCLEVTCEGLAGPCRQLLFEDCLRPQKGASGGMEGGKEWPGGWDLPVLLGLYNYQMHS